MDGAVFASRNDSTSSTSTIAGSDAASGRWKKCSIRLSAFLALSLSAMPAFAAGNAEPLAYSTSIGSTASGESKFSPSRDASKNQVSANGRFIVFTSKAANVVLGQAGASGTSNVFLYDTQSATLRLVSHASGSALTGGDLDSIEPAISADGKVIAYYSCASNLIPGFVNNGPESRGDCYNIYHYDIAGDLTRLVSHVNGSSATGAGYSAAYPTISANGRFVAYGSCASDLIPGFVQTGQCDVYRFDVTTQQNRLVSHASDSATTGGNGGLTDYPVISANGRFVAYGSCAKNLVAGYAGDTCDIYHYDADNDLTRLVSHAIGPATNVGQGGFYPAMSANGAFVTYHSQGQSLVAGYSGEFTDVFHYDVANDVTRLVSRAKNSTASGANHQSILPVINADGQFVAFNSCATNLVEEQSIGSNCLRSNVYHYSVSSDTVRLVSHASGSALIPGNGSSRAAVISADGQLIAFRSCADNLLPGYSGESCDIYRHDLSSDLTQLASHGSNADTVGGNDDSDIPGISADGKVITFNSAATNLSTRADLNGRLDAYQLTYNEPTPTSSPAPTVTPGPTSPPQQTGSGGGGALPSGVLMLGLLGWSLRRFRRARSLSCSA